jgi:formylglycine-generating enzyme required for sulfatase activity
MKKSMNKILNKMVSCKLGITLAGLLAFTVPATRADTFGTGANAFTIDFVPIGSPGNAADTTGSPNPAGAVGYNYQMGKYEVSDAIINKFNASQGLTITKDTRGPNKPATNVSWNEAARFVNWLNTSTGGFPAYKFTTGGVNDNIALWTPADTLDYNAANPFRSKRATYVLPSADEWYKAAYFNPTTNTYSDFPNGLNTAPTAVASGTAANTAVYNQSPGFGGPADITLAGGLSRFGVMGLAGNVSEWDETEWDLVNNDPSSFRGSRGGGWSTPSGGVSLSSSGRSLDSPWAGQGYTGFRVAIVATSEVRPPAVSAINPASGSMAGGTSVTITGGNFTGATAVTIGGNAATGVNVVNGTTLTAVTPAGTVGSASVVVINPGGPSAANTLYTYYRADTFGTGANTFTIDFVPIGSPGNAADTTGSPNPAGAVGYNYQMGMYEVSRGMITKANASIVNGGGNLGITMQDMTSFGGNGANRPATGVSWNEAARFVNWLNTSQGFQAAYKFTTNGVNDNIALWAPGDVGYDANNLFRNSLAKYVLPSFDEWYKAAYYDPNTSTYYDYPTGSNIQPTPVASGTAAGTAVYNQATPQGPADITRAGGLSPFGVMGLGGNVWKLLETESDLVNNSPSSERGIRGGLWYFGFTYLLSSSCGSCGTDPTVSSTIGFRVASVASGWRPPKVSAINPASGSVAGGTSVTITGSNFTGVTGVTIGGNAATGVSVVNATTLTAITPPGTVGSASVVVTTPYGGIAANPLFAYFDPIGPPAVSAINPASGSMAGGTSVMITGMNFTGVTAVTIGGNAAASVSVVNDTTLTAVTPPGTVGSASVVVINPGGPSAANTLYTYLAILTDTFGTGDNTFTIDFVPIGNAGNADDAGAGGGISSSVYGGVAYEFRMGTYEISQDAIGKATASGLSGVAAGAMTGSRPARFITWFEAAAFVNWLNTSTGHHAAYQLDIELTTLTPWASVDAWQLGGENLYRHKDAYYFLPSEDEWYKAAFHKNDGVTANYWDYATGSNSIPTAVASGTASGTAVYNGQNQPADVNLAGGLSAYGTMGQNGNASEWQESAFDGINDLGYESRVARGGYSGGPKEGLDSSSRGGGGPTLDSLYWGFRVASISQPPVLPFRITSIRYLAGATPSVELTFNSRVGRTYTVEASTAMLASGQPGGWVELTNSLQAGGTETTYVDTLTTVTGPGVFYRVRENSN